MPKSLPSMLNAAEILADVFPKVRIAFFEIDGKLFWGEMTVTSMCGMMKYFSLAFLNNLGGLLN